MELNYPQITAMFNFCCFVVKYLQHRKKRIRSLIFRKRLQTSIQLRKQFLFMKAQYWQKLNNQILSAAISHRIVHHEETEPWMEKYSNSDWVKNFRMRKSTFLMICDALRDELKPSEMSIKKPISVEKKVAITIYKLAHCVEYEVVGSIFEVHKSTAHNCLHQTIDAINKLLLPQVIMFPNENEAQNIAECIRRDTGVSQIFGFIDGVHIPILAPKEGYSNFINSEGWTSLILQAVIDNNYRFRHINTSHPGSYHDDAVLKSSALYENSQNIMPKQTTNIDGLDVPLMLLGDAAFPHLPWLMKGYYEFFSPEEESFDSHLDNARMTVEHAFGRLKARWTCLLKRIKLHHEFAPKLVAACCVLHNIVEENKEEFFDIWIQAVNDFDEKFQQPDYYCDEQDISAELIRDHLKFYMAENMAI